MDSAPKQALYSRRGSLSLSHTLSFDPPPPPADLEQIHASSSQTPGLTSFDLASPPSGAAEQLSLNKIYSRVKSVATAVRDAVGAAGSSNGGSPIKSTPGVGGDGYFQNSGSRDSFITSASDDGPVRGSMMDGKANSKISSSSRHQYRGSSFSIKYDQTAVPSSKAAKNGGFAPPAALRKVNVLTAASGLTTTPSLAPVTVFRDGLEDFATSATVSRSSSTSNLQTMVSGGTTSKTPGVLDTGVLKPSRGTFLGAVGTAVGGAVGLPPSSGNTAAVGQKSSGGRHSGGIYRGDDEEDYCESISDDETLSSSDDDVVLLHAKLPGAGTIRRRPSANNGSNVEKAPTGVDRQLRSNGNRSSIGNSASGVRLSTGAGNKKQEFIKSDRSQFSRPATSESTRTTPAEPTSESRSLQSGTAPTTTVSDSHLPSRTNPVSAQQMQHPNHSEKLILQTANDKPTKDVRSARNNRPTLLPRLSTEQSQLLPGFKISREPSSDADSSITGTTAAGSDARDSVTSFQGHAFDGRSGNGVYGTIGKAPPGSRSSEAVSQALRQLRMGNLTRDFWMKDEVCKDCFLCGSTFTAWRRKHHCRLCGQIFCSKCTTLISGDKFGHQGSMRVCSPCLEIVNDYQDESDSDEFEFSSSSVFHNPPPAGILKNNAPITPVESHSSSGFKIPRDIRPGKTPLMAIPATRTTAANNPNRRSQILEINADIPSPPRPSSSRSMNPAGIPRPGTAASGNALHSHIHAHPHHSHHKHHSRSQHRIIGHTDIDDRAPFHRNPGNRHGVQKSAFHADSILDPDLAPYMSDDDLSGEEQMSIFATIAPPRLPESSGMANNPKTIHPTPSAIGPGNKAANPAASTSAARRRAKSRSGGSLGAILGASSAEGKAGHLHPSRSSRRRNSNFVGPLQQRPVTRGKSRGLMRSLTESVSGPLGLGAGPSTPGSPSPRTSRSASMRGPLAPSVELNSASLEHVRKLLRQLLQDSDIPNIDSWEKALLPILLKSTDDLNPDVRAGDDIDIRHYVKVKRIPGGKPHDTSYISGVVCTKNLALKSMSRSVLNPRIVVVSFPIEYQRHQQQLMSLEPVIAQEREFLQNMVNRIVALRPSLLLVEENVSGLALQLLAQANVATAHHVKPSVIEAVARCAQADIFSSIDKLALSNFRLGRCARFDVRTFVHDNIPGRKKTFMYLSGCPKELGCTIVLRGADMATLAVIKQITEMMVYVVYNLKLETCLMRDEFVVIPSLPNPSDQPPSTTPEANASEKPVKQPTSSEEIRSGSENEKVDDAEPEKTKAEVKASPTNEAVPLTIDKLPDDIPDPTYYEDMVRNHETKILSSSPFVKYMQPYLLTQARGLERRLIYLRRLRDELAASEDEESSGEEVFSEKTEDAVTNMRVSADSEPAESFQLVQPEMVHGKIKGGTKKMKEALRAIYDSEYDRALHVYETQKKQWENYLAQYDDLFDPFTHQSIAVLYSMVCTITTIPCEGPEIRRLEFYDQDVEWMLGKSDTSLGQYVEYLCDTAGQTCTAVSCDKKMIEHHRSYVHGQARVSVLVSDKIACPIQGMQNTILMWSYCKICPNTNTPAIPMSESSWKYSFGKYLELAFWSPEMKLRAGNCPHDLNRDHVRCFGYHGLTVVFQYDPIDLLEIVVPRTKITYKPEIDLRIKNEQFTQHEEKIDRFFNSVKSRLKHINVDSVGAEKVEACRAEIEAHLLQAEKDRAWLVKKLREKYNKAKYYEVIPLNRALRALQEKVVEWDTKFAAFDNNYFPSEKDIRRLATLQIRKMFMDNSSTPSLQSDNETTPTQEKGEGNKVAAVDGANTPDGSAVSSPIELTSKQAHEALASVVEEEHGINSQRKGSIDSALTSPTKSDVATPGTVTPDMSSSQELNGGERTDDDMTPRQELPLEKVLPSLEDSDSISQPRETSESLSTSTLIKSRSTLTIPETGKQPESPTTKQPPTQRPGPGLSHMSSIPRLDIRRKASAAPPPLARTVSVPTVVRQRDGAGSSSAIPKPPAHVSTLPLKRPTETIRGKSSDKLKGDKKISDKFRLSSLSKKPKDKESNIPRSIPMPPRRGVSNLAKHFEQLSKEFERERAREKRQLAAKRSRALPVATSKPIVEVYRNVREAVEELSEEESPQQTPEPPSRETSTTTESSESTLKTASPNESPTESTPTPEENLGTEEHTAPPSQSQSDVDASDGEMSIISDQESVQVPSIYDVLPPTTDSSQIDLNEDLPKHRSAWMKMLSNFWAERSASGWTSLEYPLHPSDHVFNDSDIIVREDEPSSLIAFALSGQDYAEKLEDIRNSGYSDVGALRPTSSEDHVQTPFNSVDEHPELERALLKTTGTHLKYQFHEGSARMFCKIFYAEQFDALRRNCGVADRYVESLSRCTKWDSRGGKSRSVFLKSQDERIVLKSLSPIETAAFIKFAPSYFQYMSEAFFHELPTVIAKMLGFYQIYIRNPTTGVEIKWDILVMENLFYDRKTTRIFDLKGSMRNRRTEVTGDSNEVLLDENMVEFIYESPLFVREHSKKLLRTSLWNDTLFLSRQNVMDYSLMIGIDQNKELVVGIIDCIRTFTWDKKLESWVKEKGFAGGGRNKPTITSPREYKYRFREAMERYVLEAPSCWHLFRMNYMGAVPLQLHSSSSNKEAMVYSEVAEDH